MIYTHTHYTGLILMLKNYRNVKDNPGLVKVKCDAFMLSSGLLSALLHVEMLLSVKPIVELKTGGIQV